MLLYLTVALALSSCNRKTIYCQYEAVPIDGWGWERTDTLHFTVPPLHHGGAFVEEIGIRSTSAYPFVSIALIVTQHALPSGFHRSDTISVRVTGEDGNSQDTGLGLSHYVGRLPDVKLHTGDSLCVSVCHYMRREGLPGISDVGFTLMRKN